MPLWICVLRSFAIRNSVAISTYQSRRRYHFFSVRLDTRTFYSATEKIKGFRDWVLFAKASHWQKTTNHASWGTVRRRVTAAIFDQTSALCSSCVDLKNVPVSMVLYYKNFFLSSQNFKEYTFILECCHHRYNYVVSVMLWESLSKRILLTLSIN